MCCTIMRNKLSLRRLIGCKFNIVAFIYPSPCGRASRFAGTFAKGSISVQGLKATRTGPVFRVSILAPMACTVIRGRRGGCVVVKRPCSMATRRPFIERRLTFSRLNGSLSK